MSDKRTKLEISVENLSLQNQLQQTQELDQSMRREFAKVFEWKTVVKKNSYSDPETILREPSWAEIFVKVGRLLNVEAKLDLTEAVKRISNLQSEIKAGSDATRNVDPHFFR